MKNQDEGDRTGRPRLIKAQPSEGLRMRTLRSELLLPGGQIASWWATNHSTCYQEVSSAESGGYAGR